jgi:hypothetical protein
MRCSASPPRNSITSATPARCALRCAKSTMRCATSLPKMVGRLPGGGSGWARKASACSASHTWAWNGSIFSKANRRRLPGAMLQAICAASMAMVPLPQHGSYSGTRRVGGPAAGGDHRGRQRLLQRRLALVLAPAALEQRLARGVDVQETVSVVRCA